ncbi:GNAT family N-acetyltransferase [Bacillus sp. AGMB 02131]|uniref:GNAT family N-acetyltransferase n=1 Tax=Peribacillus faecalis TaxID=2772559 RepID=A0A927H9J4_9BACI|nr:GNAT family N-acyltransferase [Peribacillus faecalis]MBD3107660.1 GNAT family N-acetyltransferase [Peribacillus faecalis]
MFEIVKTQKQQKQFEQTWEYFCEKNNWYNDPYTKSGIRYLMMHPEDSTKAIGTVEFVPYSPNNPESTVERHYSFSSFPEITSNEGRVWEVDKICIHKDYQSKGLFVQFFPIFHQHALENKPKYYIALMEKKFYRMVRILFGLSVKQIGEEQLADTTVLIPVVLDIEAIMNNTSKVKQLLAMCHTSTNIKYFTKTYFHFFEWKKLFNKCRIKL